MRKNSFFFCILCIVITNAYSQKDFREGFIIKNSGDTILGFIDYRSSAYNAKKCVYKANLTANSKTYYPSDIRSYRFIEGKYYISETIGDSINKEEVFLEYLIDGIVDIYYYKSNKKEAYYVNKDNTEIIELSNQQYEESSSSLFTDSYKWKTKRYIGILKYIFSDSSPTLSKAENISLSHKSLINIAKFYHADVCSDDNCLVFEKEIAPIKLEVGVLGGYKISLIRFVHDDFDFSFNPGSDIFFGIDINLALKKVSNKVSLQFEALYTSTKVNSNYRRNTYTGIEYNYANVDFTSILNSVSIEYNYPKGKLRPNMYLGGVLDYMISNRSEIIVENQTRQRILTSNEVLFYPNRSAQAGFIVGMGADIKVFEKSSLYIKADYSYLFLSGGISSIENIKVAIGIKI